MLRDCVASSISTLKQQLDKSGENSILHRMFDAAEAGLSFQYRSAWNHVLNNLATFFEVAAQECGEIMTSVR